MEFSELIPLQKGKVPIKRDIRTNNNSPVRNNHRQAVVASNETIPRNEYSKPIPHTLKQLGMEAA